MYQETDDPEFDRYQWLRDHHESDLPAESIEVLKVYGSFYEEWDVANILGMPVARVRMWLDYVVDMICGGWPGTKPAQTFAGFWFIEHRLCCMARPVSELEGSYYPLAARYYFEQPGKRFTRLLSGSSRSRCERRWTPSGNSAWLRGLFRHGCGQWAAVLPKSQQGESPARDQRDGDDA